MTCFEPRQTAGYRRVGQGTVVGLLSLLALFLLQTPVAASDSKDREIAIQAALLVKLADYAEWPSEASPTLGSTFRVCIVGDSPLEEALESLGGTKVANRDLEIVHFRTARELEYCPVLFIAASEEPRLQQLLAAVGRVAVLTVSRIPGFCRAGGIVEFVSRINRAGYEVNPAAAARAGIKLDPQLIRLAVRTTKETD